MPNTNIWLIRHGQSSSNMGTWSKDPNEILLTNEGKTQALGIADKILMRPDLIVSSPMKRALQTAAPTRNKWADVPVEIWPIEEFIYLSPTRYQNKMPAERSVAIDEYWQHGNPLYCDDDKSESFLNFIHRVEAFHQALLNQHGFLVIFGHDQFFNAFLYGYQHGFFVTSEWMHLFRQSETAKPMLNGEIIHLELSH